jgi:uncharacterized protein YjbJ (UPF0337 family)
VFDPELADRRHGPEGPRPALTRGHAACETSVTADPAGRQGDSDMNWDRIEGNWKQLKGNVKQQWGKLTDDHLDQIGGKRDQLVGRIQEHYGIAQDEAERQVSVWESTQR